MPVYVQHYRLWAGRPTPRWLRWTVITRYHLTQLFAGKGRVALLLLLLISGVVHFLFLMLIYINANTEFLAVWGLPPGQLPRINREFFLNAFIPQGFLCGLLTLIVGSGLIADDRRDNAIPLYLSKPLMPLEYLLGKFGTLAVFLLAITALPINALYLFEVLTHGGWAFVKANWQLPLGITAFSFLITALCGAVILMASSLVKKGALAGVLVIGLFVAHNILAGILQDIYKTKKLMVISLQFDLFRAGLWLLGVRAADSRAVRNIPFSGPEALAMILIVTVVCWAVVWWRIRPVEVVK